MARKPIVAYIESDSSGVWNDENPNRDALSYFLRERCGCEVISYYNGYYFEEDLARLKRYADYGVLALVIVKQEEYSDQHQRIIELVRKDISVGLPIVVIPKGWGDKRFDGSSDDELVYAFDYDNGGLIELIDNFVASWGPPSDWLRAETRENQAILMSQLEMAYRKHYLGDNDELALGVPDYNGQIVAEALRIRLLPSQLLKAEFDDTIEEVSRDFITTERKVYEEEVSRIRAMSDAERTDFNHLLMRARGYEPAEGGGIYVRRVGCGGGVNGFAIDPVTMETLITRRLGEHHMAKDKLSRRVQSIEGLQTGVGIYGLTEEGYRECCWRIISGLIFSDIEGFFTPILQLHREDVEEEDLKKAAGYIRGGQKFIPVTSDGYLIEE